MSRKADINASYIWTNSLKNGAMLIYLHVLMDVSPDLRKECVNALNRALFSRKMCLIHALGKYWLAFCTCSLSKSY